MNKKFIITLPSSLISKICTGENKYEMSAQTSIFPPMPTTSGKENSIEKAVQ